MRKIVLLTTTIAIIAGCQAAPTHQVATDSGTVEAADIRLDRAFYDNVDAQMKANKLPGFSLAVFEKNEIIYSKQWGVKSSESLEPVNSNTAFSTASMSKAFTALLCVMLSEEGLINLDDPISDYLTSWPLPESEFTEETPVTWRHLLSHTAGTTQHGFADFYEGDKIPTLIDSLEGRLPRYDGPIDFKFEPGTDWSYSGGGYTLVQLALEDHFRKTLHALSKEYIFEPLGMTNTTMLQPNEAGFPENVAKVHDSEAAIIRSGLPITPQIAASGMWSTPTDLAKFSMALQGALHGDRHSPLSSKTIKTVTDIVTLKGPGGMSLGWFRGFGFGNVDWIRHDGSNTGVGGDMLISSHGDFGFVFFANGEKQNRFPVDSFVRSQVIKAMQWEKPVSHGKLVPEILIGAIQGSYKDFLYSSGMTSEIVSLDDGIYLVSPVFEHFLGKDRSEMIYLGNNSFKIADYPNVIRFNLNTENVVESLTLFRDENDSLTLTKPIER